MQDEDHPSKLEDDRAQEPQPAPAADAGAGRKFSRRFKAILDKAAESDFFATVSDRVAAGKESFAAAFSEEEMPAAEPGKRRFVRLQPARYDGLIESFLPELTGGVTHEAHGDPALAKALLRDAWTAKASDIHLDPKNDGVELRLRVDGILHNIRRLDGETGKKLINQYKALARINPDTLRTIEEGRFSYTPALEKLDLRVQSAPCINGTKLTIRLLVGNKVYQHLRELGLREENVGEIETALETMSGMFLAAGPTGSGKTTTLYALLHKLKNFEGNIVTIEDPVEYSIEGVNQIQVDQQHELDMATGGKALLRLDPDCMFLGEIRDPASASVAFNVASSGRILLSSIHSHEAVGVISVLRNFGISNQDIAANLNFVVAQRLVRKLCPNCRKEENLSARDREWFGRAGLPAPEKAWYHHGCEACKNIGYQGRTGVFEVWPLKDRHYEMILNDIDVISMRRKMREEGHKSLTDEALIKFEEGIIGPGELRAISGYGPLVRD